MRKGAPVTIITMNMAIKEKPRLTIPESIFENGNRYFGIYTFLISEAFEIIECIAVVVDSVVNENKSEPER